MTAQSFSKKIAKYHAHVVIVGTAKVWWNIEKETRENVIPFSFQITLPSILDRTLLEHTGPTFNYTVSLRDTAAQMKIHKKERNKNLNK